MRPSQTASGKAWLGNFEDADLPAASILLDSIRFLTLSKLREGLYSHLEELVGSGALETPAVVFPERSLSDFGLSAEQSKSAAAYRDFDPGGPIAVTPGSEAFVGMALRDLLSAERGRRDSSWIAPSAGLEEMRRQRCRSLVLVTDYMGTGNQVLKLVQALGRNRTIRSWLSFNWIQIHVVAFAASPEAIRRVRKDKDVSSASTVEAAPTFETAPWEPEVREAIVELCELKCGVNPRWALGFDESGGLFVTERGAPNNLPAVFWQDPRGWVPLFESRIVPVEFARQVGDYRDVEPLPEFAERLGQLRLGRNQRLSYMRKTSRSLLKALILLGDGRRDIATLAAELGGDLAEAESLVGFLEQMQWVDSAGAITALGREEIAANRRGLRRTTAGLTGSDDPYYPQSVR
jgi:hypothetical protein